MFQLFCAYSDTNVFSISDECLRLESNATKGSALNRRHSSPMWKTSPGLCPSTWKTDWTLIVTSALCQSTVRWRYNH